VPARLVDQSAGASFLPTTTVLHLEQHAGEDLHGASRRQPAGDDAQAGSQVVSEPTGWSRFIVHAAAEEPFGRSIKWTWVKATLAEHASGLDPHSANRLRTVSNRLHLSRSHPASTCSDMTSRSWLRALMASLGKMR
jgi:hypothetical protein